MEYLIVKNKNVSILKGLFEMFSDKNIPVKWVENSIIIPVEYLKAVQYLTWMHNGEILLKSGLDVFKFDRNECLVHYKKVI